MVEQVKQVRREGVGESAPAKGVTCAKALRQEEKGRDSLSSHSEKQNQGWSPGSLAPRPGLPPLSLVFLPVNFISDGAAAAAVLKAEEFWP